MENIISNRLVNSELPACQNHCNDKIMYYYFCTSGDAEASGMYQEENKCADTPNNGEFPEKFGETRETGGAYAPTLMNIPGITQYFNEMLTSLTIVYG